MSLTAREVDKKKIPKLLRDGVLKKVACDEESVKVLRESYYKVVHTDDDVYSSYLSCRRCGDFFKYSGSKASGSSALTDHRNRCEKKGKTSNFKM